MHPDLPTFLCNDADYTILGEGQGIDRHILDTILPDRPLVLMVPDHHHTVWAHTTALDAAGLLWEAQMPPANEIVMGADGLAQGELREHHALTRSSRSGRRDSLTTEEQAKIRELNAGTQVAAVGE